MVRSRQVPAEQVLEVFLAPAPRHWLAEPREDELLQPLEAYGAPLDLPPVARVEARVPVRHEPGKLAVGDDPARDLEGERVRVHPADVRMEEVLGVDGRAGQLGVK